MMNLVQQRFFLFEQRLFFLQRCVFERDRCLRRQKFEHRKTRRGEHTWREVVFEVEHAHQPRLLDERQTQHGARSGRTEIFVR